MIAPGAFVIFGATGDLARRMLFPSLYFLDADGLLPPGMRIVCAARSRLTDDQFRAFSAGMSRINDAGPAGSTDRLPSAQVS